MKPRRTRLLLVLLLSAVATGARADGIDDYVKAQLRKHQIPGLALAAIQNGRTVRRQGYGLANVEWNAPVAPDTVFQSGSMGKQFTAMAVMMLVHDGKIGLDDPIGKYLDGAPPAWRGITVRRLLNHTSGIGDIQPSLNLQKDYTEADLLRMAEAVPNAFAPGETWRYSNTGYMMLGVLIGKVTGRFYGDFLRDRIFKALGMTTARVINEADIIPRRAAGYRLVDGALKNQEWVSPSLNTTADGALYITLDDLVKWDAGLASNRLLPRSEMDQLWTPAALNDGATAPYGFGWFIEWQRGHRNIEHGGAWQGFTTHIARYLDDGLSVIVLCNLAGADPGAIAHGVAGLLQPSLLLATLMKPASDPDPAQTARLRDFVKDFAAGNDRARPLLVPARLAATLPYYPQYLSSRIAGMQSFTYLGSDDVAARAIQRYGARPARMVYYRLATPAASHSMTFYLTADGKIVDFDIHPD